MLEDLGAKFQLSQKIIPRFEFQYDHLEIFFWKEKIWRKYKTNQLRAV